MSGLFGVVAKRNCSDLLFYGTDYHSHLGTQYGGLAIYSDCILRRIHSLQNHQFKSRFYDDYKLLKGNMGIGVISAHMPQPMMLNSRFGEFAVAMDGNVLNHGELVKELLASGTSFSDPVDGEVNDVELVAKIINRGQDIVDGIKQVFERVEGGVSMLVLTADGIYAARDAGGHSALAIGRHEDAYVVATETCAFPNLEIETTKFLAPGEIVRLTADGLESIVAGRACGEICSFLWIYSGFPASHYEGINVEEVRERCGACLARRDHVEADFAAGVPDSGVAHAIGYAMEKGIPYRRPLVKYTAGYGRSYTPPSQEIRDLVAKMKLVPIREVINGNRIVICDDSIVRGTQLKNFTVANLWNCGAREVHVRLACPPLLFPCKYNISTRTTEELVARRAIKAIEGRDPEDISEYLDPSSEKFERLVEWIAKDLGVTTLQYQTVGDMLEAIGFDRKHLCTYCWTGQDTAPAEA